MVAEQRCQGSRVIHADLLHVWTQGKPALCMTSR
jgi:hypothetical protein